MDQGFEGLTIGSGFLDFFSCLSDRSLLVDMMNKERNNSEIGNTEIGNEIE